MELKQNAAGRKPAASQQRITSTDKAHDTTTPNRLDLHVILSRVQLEDLAAQDPQDSP